MIAQLLVFFVWAINWDSRQANLIALFGLKNLFNTSSTKTEKKTGMSLEGQTLVFTGKLSITREEATEKATAAGALVRTAVSGRTNIVVVGENAGAKLSRARERGLAIWTEAQFQSALRNLNPVSGGDNLHDEKSQMKPDRYATNKVGTIRKPDLHHEKSQMKPEGSATHPVGARKSKKSRSINGMSARVELVLIDPELNHKKFYNLSVNGPIVCREWGRIGQKSKKQCDTLASEKASEMFARLFHRKTGNSWGEKFRPRTGKYLLAEACSC